MPGAWAISRCRSFAELENAVLEFWGWSSQQGSRGEPLRVASGGSTGPGGWGAAGQGQRGQVSVLLKRGHAWCGDNWPCFGGPTLWPRVLPVEPSAVWGRPSAFCQSLPVPRCPLCTRDLSLCFIGACRGDAGGQTRLMPPPSEGGHCPWRGHLDSLYSSVGSEGPAALCS